MKIKDIAFDAVKEAGKILMNNIGQIKTIHLKQKNDFLTNVDVEAENKIKEIIKTAFPHHSFVAEESEIEKNSTPFTWYIDPISSTMNYVHGLPHFAVAISLREHDQFIFSVVLDPFFHELFYAEKGAGAYCNDKKIHVSSINNLSSSIVSLVLNNKGTKDSLHYFEDTFNNIATYRRLGSLALELCYIASGRIEGMAYTKTDIFSLPAGKVILEEAGGKITDFDGVPWDILSKNIIASNGKIHNEFVKVVSNKS